MRSPAPVKQSIKARDRGSPVHYGDESFRLELPPQDRGDQPLALSIHRYGPDSSAHAHDFSQLVLPVQGSLEMDLAGRTALLDRSRAAYVPEGLRHEQVSQNPNQFLVVDLQPGRLDAEVVDRLSSRPFLLLTPLAAHLIDYMAGSLSKAGAAERAALWTPLLLDALVDDEAQPPVRLSHLLLALRSSPSHGWTVAEMAARMSISTSRLHALFREELGTTPQAWLLDYRLACARQWLASTRMSLAEIASRAGFSDQSALTRALRRVTGMTPGAYRQQVQESGSKKQEF